MESDLIEISGEDDSLLQEYTNDGVSSSSICNNGKTYFACSPLHILRSKPASGRPLPSPIESLMGPKNAEKSSSSPVRDNINKENFSGSKLEVPKLSVERQQMKRKKKGGGYNLRKSLAWDRAFFTEEGVLNPLELSMISGKVGQSGGETLSVIHEERRESLSCLNCSNDSADLQALEENLFKELSEDMNVTGSMLPKNDSSARDNAAPAPLVKRKVLSAHDVNRSGSKRSGCPRPLASSSLKRPANVNRTTATSKESTVAKTTIPRPNPSVLANAAKRAIQGTSKSKQNQLSQPVNVQKSFGSRGFSKNSKSSRNDAKSSLATKSSVPKSSNQQARRKVVSSESQTHSSANLQQHPLDTKATNGIKVESDLALPSTGHASSGPDAGSSNIAISLPKNSCNIGGSMQYAHLQTVKPSGLRMPSPSLGFFTQSKLSASHGSVERSTQPCNLCRSNIPDLRKLVNYTSLRPPPTPGKVAELINDVATIGNIRISSKSAGCSSTSTVSTASYENTILNSQKDILKVEFTLPCIPNSSETTNERQQCGIHDDADQQSLAHGEPCKIGKISRLEDKELLSNNNELLLCSEQTKKDDRGRVDEVKYGDLSGTRSENSHFTSHVSLAMQVNFFPGTNGLIQDQPAKVEQCDSAIKNHGFSSVPRPDDAHSYGAHVSSKSNDMLLSSASVVNDRSQDQHENMKPCIFARDARDHYINGESQRSEVKKGPMVNDGESSKDLQELNTTNSQKQVCSTGKLERSVGLSYLGVKEQAKDSASNIDDFRENLYVGDAQVQTLDANLSLEHGRKIINTSVLTKQQVVSFDVGPEKFGDHELANPCLLAGQISMGSYGLHLHEADGLSDEASQVENVPQSDKCVAIERADESELKNTAALCPPSQAIQGCPETECHHVEVAGSDSTYEQLGHDMELSGKATSSQSERMGKDQIGSIGRVSEIDITEVLPNSGEASGGEAEDLCFTSELIPEMQVDVGYGVSLITEHKDMEDKQHSPSVKNHSAIPDLQPGEDLYYPDQGVLEMHIDSLSGKHALIKQSLEQHKLTLSSSIEVDKTSLPRNQSPKMSHGVFSEGRLSFQEFRKFDGGNSTAVSPKVKGPSERGIQSQLECKEQPNEIAEFESVVGNVPLPSSESCNSNFSNSAVISISSVGVNDANEQSEENVGHQNPGLTVGQVSTGNYGKLFLNNILPEEFQGNLTGGNFDIAEQSGTGGSELHSSTICVPLASTAQSRGVGVYEKAGYLPEDDLMSGFVEIRKSENLKCNVDMKLGHDSEPSGQLTSSELHSSPMDEEYDSEALDSCNSKAFCSWSGASGLLVETSQILSNGNIIQHMEVNVPENNSLPKEAETNISRSSNGPKSGNQHELCNARHTSEDKVATRSLMAGNDKKPDALVIRPRLDAIPFSEEWLAAFEAAGEEILTLKSGAVQNSPPEKSLPEPGPWSPVKRNNQGIGPFDCTKFTNISAPPSSD